MDRRGEREEQEGQTKAEIASVDYFLGPEDFKKFIPGRSRDEILKDVQWRGNFEMATEYHGDEVSAISFGLFGGVFGSDSRGTILWAIFVGDKFQKFVKWPERNEKPEKLSEFSVLLRAVEGEPVSISDLEKQEVKPAAPSKIDPGLTVAFLLFKPALDFAMKRNLKKNAKLRDQYNASRLKLGMTEKEVESVLKAKPIESGEFHAGTWKIYGSTEMLDIINYLHYSNILILFKSGKISGIYSGSTVPSRENGLRSLREAVRIDGFVRRPSFADLPPSKAPAE